MKLHKRAVKKRPVSVLGGAERATLQVHNSLANCNEVVQKMLARKQGVIDDEGDAGPRQAKPSPWSDDVSSGRLIGFMLTGQEIFDTGRQIAASATKDGLVGQGVFTERQEIFLHDDA